MAASVKVGEREDGARKLLTSSARHTLDPAIEIDWDAPLVDGRWGMLPERTSLYGTALWDRLDERERITHSEHEVASLLSVGLWFEVILMQMLTRYATTSTCVRATLSTRSPRSATRPGTR